MNNFKEIFGYFIFITLIFIIISIILIKTDINNELFYIEYIYIFIVIFGSYVINISTNTDINEKNRLTVLLYTLLPWVIIFIGVYILLKVYSNWITPFSNTIGYIFVNNILGLSKKFKELINNNKEKIDEDNEHKIIEAIANFNNNYEILLNSLNPDDNDGFKNFFKDFHKAKILNDTAKIDDGNDNENIKDIKQLLKIKDFIGKICWFILAGTLSISVMNNSMNDI